MEVLLRESLVILEKLLARMRKSHRTFAHEVQSFGGPGIAPDGFDAGFRSGIVAGVDHAIAVVEQYIEWHTEK